MDEAAGRLPRISISGLSVRLPGGRTVDFDELFALVG